MLDLARFLPPGVVKRAEAVRRSAIWDSGGLMTAFHQHAFVLILGALVLGGCHCNGNGPGGGYYPYGYAQTRFAVSTAGQIACETRSQPAALTSGQSDPAEQAGSLLATVRVVDAPDNAVPTRARGRVLFGDAETANAVELFMFEDLPLELGAEKTVKMTPQGVEKLRAYQGQDSINLTLTTCSEPQAAHYDLELELGADAASKP
ncbi:MAG TPA: hypothetical protein VKB87_21130 [Myxococcaceae bacterium]|nr:hypothetical protein [Myxococcaceae bacterium]